VVGRAFLTNLNREEQTSYARTVTIGSKFFSMAFKGTRSPAEGDSRSNESHMRQH
jgi:hypothetical protein